MALTDNSKNPKFSPSSLSKLSKTELCSRDVFGRTILHLIIICNRPDFLRHLLKNPETKIIIPKTDYQNGWNCLHYIIFLKRFNCYKVLLDYLKTVTPAASLSLTNNTLFFDLIRCKDRDRTTPLQLLDNDFKDMIWVPEFVSETDEIRFKYRFNREDDDEKQFTKKIRSSKDHHNWWDPKRSGSDVYMFGSNLNNNLGVGDSTDRLIPCRLPGSYFVGEQSDMLAQPRFKAVKLSKNHSMVLTKDGSLFSCGIGSRGRLGHGIESMSNCYRFKRIDFFHDSIERKYVKDFAVSNDHSLALTHSNEIFTWGLNNFQQLGYKLVAKSNNANFSEPFEAEPKPVNGGDIRKNSLTFKGTAVSRIHSLVFTKSEIFFWGLNIGQMGIPVDSNHLIEYKVNGFLYHGSIQQFPKTITLRDEIKLVETCETCTCVVTSNNELHLFTQNQHIKLPRISTGSSKDFHIFSPTKLTKQFDIAKVCMKSQENILILLESGDVVGFGIDASSNLSKLSKSCRYNSIWKSHDRALRANDIDISNDGSIVLTTTTGLVFVKHSNIRTRKNSLSETALPLTTKNKFRRIDYVNKIARVACDETFGSFGFIRDDVDLIPLQLQTNSYIKDLEYLSVLNATNLYRKQDQLLESSESNSVYESDFLYPKYEEEEYESDDEETLENQEKEGKFDLLYRDHIDKFDPNHNKRLKTRMTYEQISEQSLESYKEAVKLSSLDHYRSEDDKGYDAFIKFKDNPNISIGIHKNVFAVRSRFFKKLIGTTEDEYFASDSIQGKFENDELTFHSHVNLKSVLILVHFVYTNTIISVWDDYPTGIHCPNDIKELKSNFEALANIFQVMDVFGSFTKNDKFLQDMRSLYEFDQTHGNLSIKLRDGSVRCSSYILSTRSAFFETTLASRWREEVSVLEFSEVDAVQFDVVLRHIYGYSDYLIFDELKQACESRDDFISYLLEVMQIADELLLFQLKNLCQLAIKDLVSLDNVILLLVQSEDLKANKLFISCCWYIFNNLEIILLDPTFLTIPNDTLVKLETQIEIFNKCKVQELVKSNQVDTSQLGDWMNTKAQSLVGSFVSNVEQFNENFMSDAKGSSSFEPLVDVKLDIKVDQTKRNRRSSRKSSSNRELKDELAEIRRVSLLQAQKNESAIDGDEDFEVVSSNRRKSSAKKTVDFRKEESPVSPSPNPTIEGPRRSTSGPSKSEGFPILGKSSTDKPKPSTGSGLSPHSNWASKSTGSSILKTPLSKTPILTSSASTSNGDWTSRKPKPKIGPTVKLSQKERKKLAQQPDSTPLKPNFSWGSSSSAKEEPVTDGFPTLAKTSKGWKKAKSTSPSPPPSGPQLVDSVASSSTTSLSLTDIMIEESLKIEEARQAEIQRKSLQEIQQEQEFAKWWEEETKRVQAQLQSMTVKKKGKKKRNNSNNRPNK